MTDKKSFIYTGPSWAYTAYENVHDDINISNNDINLGNLLNKEFEYEMHWHPRIGGSNIWLHNNIKELSLDKKIPIIWVYCEPLASLHYNKEMNRQSFPFFRPQHRPFVEKFLTSSNWEELRFDLADADLKILNEMGNPIGLIGSHSDILPEQVEKYENLTVLEPSWQFVIAKEVGITTGYRWGVDFAHQMIKVFLENSNITNYLEDNKIETPDKDGYGFADSFGKIKYISKSKGERLMKIIFNNFGYRHKSIDKKLVDVIDDTYNFWKLLEEKGIFTWVHTNIKGNKVFHKHIKTKVKKFIDDHT